MVTDVERAVYADRLERLLRSLITDGEVAHLTGGPEYGLGPCLRPDDLADEHETVPQTTEEAHTPTPVLLRRPFGKATMRKENVRLE